MEMMQGNFGKTINTDRDYSAPHTDRGVAFHFTVDPRSRTHTPWQNRTEGNRNRPRQTDLTTMGMATEKQVEAGMCSLTVNLGCMRQQDRKRVVWNLGRCLLYVVDPIVVCIVDAGQVNRFIRPPNCLTFVEQNPNSHFL